MAILLKLIINILNRFETVWDRFGPPKPETKLFQTDWDFPKPNHLKWFGFGLNQVWIGFKPNFPNTIPAQAISCFWQYAIVEWENQGRFLDRLLLVPVENILLCAAFPDKGFSKSHRPKPQMRWPIYVQQRIQKRRKWMCADLDKMLKGSRN